MTSQPATRPRNPVFTYEVDRGVFVKIYEFNDGPYTRCLATLDTTDDEDAWGLGSSEIVALVDAERKWRQFKDNDYNPFTDAIAEFKRVKWDE